MPNSKPRPIPRRRRPVSYAQALIRDLIIGGLIAVVTVGLLLGAALAGAWAISQ